VRLTTTRLHVTLNIDPKAYVAKLTDQQKEVEQAIKQLTGRLANKAYVANAPAKVVEQTRSQLDEAEARLAAIKTEKAKIHG
jgi:valyl-tRNA synthetase